MRNLLILTIMMSFAITTFAQAPQGEAITITGADALAIQGDYYPADEGNGLAVLLLHMNGGDRNQWNDLLPALNDAGIAALAVDMRGHGATGSGSDWALAEQDTQFLLDWLKAQDGVEQVALAGASIGSSMALIGASNDADVVTAIALSPGLSYFGVETLPAVQAMPDRPIFVVASRDDGSTTPDAIELFGVTNADAKLQLYDGRLHGTRLFAAEPQLIDEIVTWLLAHRS